MARKTITIRYGDLATTVGYFSGSSIESISRSASASFVAPALQLSASPSGPALSANDPIPNVAWASLSSAAPMRVTDDPLPLAMQPSASSEGLPDDPAFQGQYIKFERVLSHLASERTWLAWLRAALTLLGVSFTLWELYAKVSSDSQPILKEVVYWLGIGYAVVVPLTIVVGWVRYEKTKAVLALSDSRIHEHFGHLGVKLQACTLGIVLLMTIVSYSSLGRYYIFDNT